MKRVLIPALLAVLVAGASAQGLEQADNSKLQPLIGSWQGKTTFSGLEPADSTIRGSKVLAGQWVQLELKFDAGEIGTIEAIALLCTGEDGNVEGHFFASVAEQALFGKGKVVDKKLTILASSLSGESQMRFEFDFSTADTLKMVVADTENAADMLSGTYTRKK